MTRLDQELVARALVRSRTEAAKLIAAGLVSSGTEVLNKASTQVTEATELQVQPSPETTYVSRAGLKLRGALDLFTEVTVSGKRCLDAGASTGGFTDVLLRDGAATVVAVDVGHDQLVDSLRSDTRVQVHEGMNVRFMGPEEIGGPAELVVADLSFISLTLVIDALAACTSSGGELLLMVKPQFEVGRERLARTGVVTSDAERQRAVQAVTEAALKASLTPRGLALSPLPGQDGNREYFLWLSNLGASQGQRPALTPKIPLEESARDRAHEWVSQHWPTAR